MFLDYFFLNINKVCYGIYNLSYTTKLMYSSFFFQRFILKKYCNNSLFSYNSYLPKGNQDDYFLYYKRYSFIFYNKDFSYWLNNYLTKERYNPFIITTNFLLIDYNKYVYVFLW